VYAPFPELLPFFKCILEIVLCEDVQHRLRFCLDLPYCVKMADFQFYLQSGEQRTEGWVGGGSHVGFDKKFTGEKGSCEGVLS
jgi:hypothetical protein